MDEQELLLQSVEKKAAEATKKELESFKSKLPEYATPDDIEKKFKILSDTVDQLGVKALKDQVESISTDVRVAVLEMKKLQENAENKENSGSIEEKTRKMLVDNVEVLKDFKNKNTSSIRQTLTMKDAVISGRTDISGNTVAHFVPGIGQIQRRKPFLRELFNAGRVSPNNHGVLRYVDQASIVSGATNISEKGAFPDTSAITWIERTLPIEKIGDSIKISREMMDDVDFVQGEVRRLLDTNMMLKVDTQLLSGNGSTPQLKGLVTSATAFSLNNVFLHKIVSANEYDLILVIAAQIASGTSYSVNGVLMNDLDVAAMRLTKDALNNYVLPPFSIVTQNGIVSVDSIRIIANSGVAANTCYIGDFSKGTVYSSEELTFEFGYENDDFTKNLVTLICLERLALLIRIVDNGAFNYVSSISDVLSQLKKAV